MIQDERFEGEVVDTSVVFHGRVWDVRSDVVRYGDGEIVRDYVDHTGAAAVVAVDDEHRVLLIQQYRHPIRHRDWEIPAGLLDVAGESPAETARRELAEEVDLAAGSLEPLVSLFTSPGGSDEIVHVFLARDLVQLSAHERTDEEADIVAQWVPLSEVVDAILAGGVRNGILISGVLAAAERLRRDDPVG